MSEKLKKTLIVWVSIYPPLTFILWAFSNPLSKLPLPQRTFVLTIILVPLMTYILIPFWTRIFDLLRSEHWRRKRKPASKTSNILKN